MIGGRVGGLHLVFKSLPALRLHALRDLSLAGQTRAEDRVAFLFSVGSTGWRGLGTDQCFTPEPEFGPVGLSPGSGSNTTLLETGPPPPSPSVRPQAMSPEQALLPLCLCNDFPGSHNAYYQSHNEQSPAS